MVGVGGVGGLLFGGTNVGVQLVAYVRSLSLAHGLFIGVIAMIFLGLNAVRVAVAGGLGLYPTGWFVFASIAASIPALVGVLIGKQVRPLLHETQQRVAVLGLLSIIGIRLVLDGVTMG